MWRSSSGASSGASMSLRSYTSRSSTPAISATRLAWVDVEADPQSPSTGRDEPLESMTPRRTAMCFLACLCGEPFMAPDLLDMLPAAHPTAIFQVFTNGQFSLRRWRSACARSATSTPPLISNRWPRDHERRAASARRRCSTTPARPGNCLASASSLVWPRVFAIKSRMADRTWLQDH